MVGIKKPLPENVAQEDELRRRLAEVESKKKVAHASWLAANRRKNTAHLGNNADSFVHKWRYHLS